MLEPVNFPLPEPLGLMKAIARAGYRIEQRDGIFVADPAGAVQAIIDGHDIAPWLGDLKTEKRVATKLEARNRILAAYPEWKQANMTARGVELQDLWRVNGSWTAQEQAEADALKAAWAWIKSVRAASDIIEQDIEAMSDAAGIEAFNPATSNRWP